MSEQKDSEMKPAKQKSNLTGHRKMILETSIDGFCVVGLDGKLLEVNTSLCNITGYSKEELLKMTLTNIEAAETPEQIAQHIDTIMKQGYDRFETKHRRKDGKIIDVEVSSKYCDFDEDRFFCSFFRDIAEQKQMKAELRLKEKAIHGSINGFAIADLEGKLIYVNPAFLDMWGYDKKEEVLGRKAIDFWQKKEHAENVQQTLSSEVSCIGELTAKKRDGSFFDVLLSASAVKDDAGEFSCLMASFIDIS